jgi:nucleotide-binding universal stress UspA family protein
MSIVIAVDASDAAASVVQAVAPRLREWHTGAHLLTVIDPDEAHGQRRSGGPATYHSETMPADLSGGSLPGAATGGPSLQPLAEDRGQALAGLEDDRRQGLQQLAADHLSGVAHEVHIEAADDVAKTICEFAEEHSADMIAIGTHGRTGLRRALMGSVAEAVIRCSNVPVLVVREGIPLPAD